MPAWVRSQGDVVHHTRGARLRRAIGVETRSPNPRVSQRHPEHRRSPSVVRGVPLPRVQPVWRTDLPSLRLQGGLLSLVAVMDGLSRSGLSGAGASTLDGDLCLEAWDHAVEVARPDICTSDQGAHFTRLACTGRLVSAESRRRMAGRGRALENVLIERLWRPLTSEEGYVKD
jgi:putative transposase